VRVSRFGAAIAAALCVHAPAALVIAHRHLLPWPEPSTPDALVVLDEEPVPAAAAEAEPSGSPAPAPPRNSAVSASPPRRATVAGAASACASQTTSADVAEPWSFSPTREPPGAAASSPPVYGHDRPLLAPDATRPSREGGALAAVTAALDAHDRALGLGAGGPLIAAARAAASTSRIPVESSATLVAPTVAEGHVVAVLPTDGSGDASAWNDVAARVLQEMRGKPLHVPRGARGVRIALRIVSQVRRAAGHDGGPTVRAGTPLYRCQEACTASGNIDPTDAVLNATDRGERAIHVQTLTEERLP
jgi:hypothetical protein